MSKKSLIPKLRFPEFVNEVAWKIKPIEENIDLISGIALRSEELSENKSGTPILRGINITEGEIRHSSDIDRYYLGDKSELEYCLVQEDDIVISMDGSKVGKNVALVSRKDSGSILIQRVARIRAVNAEIKYLYQLFLSSQFIDYVDKVNTSSGIPHISAKQIRDFKIGFPPKLEEQQKIAACLSSLDELIAAHTEKLEALKDHKKGLMQNLFPQEGQKVPKLRFPEFENDGEWVEKLLSEVANYENGKAHEQDISDSGNFVVVNSKFISTDGEVAKYSNSAYCLAEKGDILMVLSDIPNGRAIAKCFYVNEENKYTVNQRICKLTSFGCDSLFLYYAMNRNQYFLAFDDGVKQTNLRNVDVQSFPFLVPLDQKEQQKIASCLSAADELIAAQAEKIVQLQQHKKGLMQGLFPEVNN